MRIRQREPDGCAQKTRGRKSSPPRPGIVSSRRNRTEIELADIKGVQHAPSYVSRGPDAGGNYRVSPKRNVKKPFYFFFFLPIFTPFFSIGFRTLALIGHLWHAVTLRHILFRVPSPGRLPNVSGIPERRCRANA